ncbi:MAG: DUF2779 domain-containing protein [Bacilli bacterium]|nr:DUF2779 domain-containing protein [Bacilli bacterium]
MKISKSLFKNLSRCDNFASLYDMYTFRNMHHIYRIYNEEKDINKRIEDLSLGIFEEQTEKALEIFSNMFDEETGEDLTEVTNAQLEAMMPYFSRLEIMAAKTIEKLFPGKLTFGESIKEQKKFSFVEGEHEYYCYLDIYNECDDGKIRIFEVKATTSGKFLKLGEKNAELDAAKKANPLLNISKSELYDSIFIKNNNGIYYLKEEFDNELAYIVNEINTNPDYVIPKEFKKYIDNRAKLFKRYSSDGTGKYVYDIAIERFIVENSLKINKEISNKDIEYYLVVLNADYELAETINTDTLEYPKDLKGNELIVCFNLDKITEEYQSIIEEEKKYICECIERKTIDKCCISEHCENKKTTECKFKKVCFDKVLKDGSILENTVKSFESADKKEKYSLFELIREGYHSILDVPEYLITKPKQILQYNCLKNNVEYIDKELVSLTMNEINYPLYHLDFESFNCPIPRYIGEHPYSQSVFQFSLHIEKNKGFCDKEKDHFEFLAKDHEDHRRELCEKMIEYIDLSNGGSVLVYNAAFEKSRLAELAIIFPDLAPALLKIRNAVFDLMDVVKGKKDLNFKLLPNELSVKEKNRRCELFNYYNNGLHGSFSIKKVLPLFTNLTYSTLTVKNGTEAILTYALLPTLTVDEYNRLYLALRKYCQQDTWAMVEVLWGLQNKIKNS